MNQRMPLQAFDHLECEIPARRTAAKRFVSALLLIGVIAAGVGVGYRLGRTEHPLPGWVPPEMALLLGARPESQQPPPTGPIVYYRHPDGVPFYSAEPRKTEHGRDNVPVRASEDVSFDDGPPGSPAAAGLSEDGKRILYYRNPMGLPYTSPVPKKDSMGMDYIPVDEGEIDDGTTVTISPGKLQRTGVRSEAGSRRVLTHPIRVPGTVKLDERRLAVVSLRSDSFIDKVENVTTGDRVRSGQPLLRLYSPEIAAAAAQYLSILSESGRGGGRLEIIEGARRRLENLAVPPEVIAEIESTRDVPLTITWSAPRDGIVLERDAVEGMMAPAGQVLFRLADISTVWVLADVPERELGMVEPGQPVSVRMRSLPGRSFAGHIALIYPQVSAETRTTRVRIEIPNPEGVLLPDMYADVEVATGSDAAVIAVPDSALIDSGTRQVVILDKDEGRFESREVKLGVRGEALSRSARAWPRATRS